MEEGGLGGGEKDDCDGIVLQLNWPKNINILFHAFPNLEWKEITSGCLNNCNCLPDFVGDICRRTTVNRE